jgi:hypothetical protein
MQSRAYEGDILCVLGASIDLCRRMYHSTVCIFISFSWGGGLVTTYKHAEVRWTAATCRRGQHSLASEKWLNCGGRRGDHPQNNRTFSEDRAKPHVRPGALGPPHTHWARTLAACRRPSPHWNSTCGALKVPAARLWLFSPARLIRLHCIAMQWHMCAARWRALVHTPIALQECARGQSNSLTTSRCDIQLGTQESSKLATTCVIHLFLGNYFEPERVNYMMWMRVFSFPHVKSIHGRLIKRANLDTYSVPIVFG